MFESTTLHLTLVTVIAVWQAMRIVVLNLR
jgi:hypothetical protein